MVTFNQAVGSEESADQWWAWSPAHGWVFLDRRLLHNRLSTWTEGFEFVRCRDWTSFEQGDQPWNYREATRYLNSLLPAEAWERAKELAAHQARLAKEDRIPA